MSGSDDRSAGGFLGAGYALYAWFKLRDKPTAIQSAGCSLIVVSTMLAKWFDVVVMFVGLGITCYGLVLTMRRAREAEEAACSFAPAPRSRPQMT